MNNKIFTYFEIAAKLSHARDDERTFLIGAVAIRGDGTMISSINMPSKIPNRIAHAEYRLHKKLDYGAVVYVARMKLQDMNFGMARPCINCQKVLISRKVSKVYYTISPFEWGMWNPKTGVDTYYSKR